ncbi:lysozyme inhibitor LprI family protein [Paenibacillus piscarius]|uniref:lysozyme inhibitor LprI family protein n=1 Tax=Paenibacillus piscarius TaxID=1089681 RepID=UPI001EE9A5BC|nr:lysozyme inhibitor LprI family protein [Paenibacillus piscarius]
MKGKILLLFFIATVLSACHNSSQPTMLNSETKSIMKGNMLPKSIGNYDLKGEFYDEMLQNPIDHDYEVEFNEFQNSEEFTTFAWRALVGKYTEVWDKELNQVYNKLLAKLDRESKQALIESQREWLKYHLRETEFVGKTFIDNGYLGTQGSVSLDTVTMERIRERTMQLFEYRFLLDGEVEFVYQGKK